MHMKTTGLHIIGYIQLDRGKVWMFAILVNFIMLWVIRNKKYWLKKKFIQIRGPLVIFNI